MTECDTDSPTEHVLPLEDAVCAINLSTSILHTGYIKFCFRNYVYSRISLL